MLKNKNNFNTSSQKKSVFQAVFEQFGGKTINSRKHGLRLV